MQYTPGLINSYPPYRRSCPLAGSQSLSNPLSKFAREKRRPRTRPLAPKNFSRSNPCARLSQAVQQQIKFSATTADRWNFGLCATIPREPRQARKGATVAGQLRVPRITRSSSLLLSQVREPQDEFECRTKSGVCLPWTINDELQSHRSKISPANVYRDRRAAARHPNARQRHQIESRRPRLHLLRRSRRRKNHHAPASSPRRSTA